MGQTELLLNTADRVHGDVLIELLAQAQHFECLAAFAKQSALPLMYQPLEKALKRGMTARFVIGRSFCLTEPDMLRKLFKLSSRLRLKLYLSATPETFHPKVYAAKLPRGCRVVIGSANLTAGGLQQNCEASLVVNARDRALFDSAQALVDELIAEGLIVEASTQLIDAYEVEFTVHDAWRKMVKKSAEQATDESEPNLDVLAQQLRLMKRDRTSNGFDVQKAGRRRRLRRAKRELHSLARWQPQTGTRGFLSRFEALLDEFPSGGLERGKTSIESEAARFLAALVDIENRTRMSPAVAFDVLHGHFRNIPRAGINLLTEVLHTLDNKRFAVMNQNAVRGMSLAGFRRYPARPLKSTVNGELYQAYCRDALAVRRGLGLANFSELDALFNYTYWNQAAAD